MPDPDDPGNPPGDGDGDGDAADDEESRLEEWVDDAGESEETHDFDYDANLPDSVIPQLNNDGIQKPPTGEPPAGEEAAEADVEFEFTDPISRAIEDLEEAGRAESRAEAAEEAERQAAEVADADRREVEAIKARKLAEKAEEAAKVKKILDDQRELLDSIEAPKLAPAKAKKKRFNSALERLVGGIGLFMFLGFIGYGCTQVFGDDDDTVSNEPAADDLVTIGQVDDVFPDTPTEPEMPVEAAEEVAPPRPAGSGTTEITAFVDNVCGGLYDVFLRVIAFNNFQITSDQLLTKNGNPSQSATGWANSNVAMATLTQEDFYEVWFFVWNLGDLLAIYNVYGISADFTPPASADDLAQYESVNSPEALASAIGASADSCAAEVQVDEAVTTPFPESNS